MSEPESNPTSPESIPGQTEPQPAAAGLPEESAAPASDNSLAGGLDDLMSSFQLAPSWARDGGDSPDKWQKFEGRDYRDDRRSRGGGDRGGPRRDSGRGPGGVAVPAVTVRRAATVRVAVPAATARAALPAVTPRGRPGRRSRFSGPPAGGPGREDRAPPRVPRRRPGRFPRRLPPAPAPAGAHRLPARAHHAQQDRQHHPQVVPGGDARRHRAPLPRAPRRAAGEDPPREGTPPEQAVVFHQVKGGAAFYLDRAEAEAGIMRTGLSEYYETAEVEIPAPTGKFTCVAKCGITGELLGPPNHHSYAEAVERIRAERCPEIPLEDYKRRVIMMHEPESVEAWKQSQTKVVKYGEKGAEEKTLTRREAEHAFRTKHLPGLISEARRIIAPMRAAMAVTDPILSRQLRECLEREQARPFSILLALRPALKHMGLHFFKARGGQQHVAAAAPRRSTPRRSPGRSRRCWSSSPPTPAASATPSWRACTPARPRIRRSRPAWPRTCAGCWRRATSSSSPTPATKSPAPVRFRDRARRPGPRTSRRRSPPGTPAPRKRRRRNPRRRRPRRPRTPRRKAPPRSPPTPPRWSPPPPSRDRTADFPAPSAGT
ncbi:MAG: hypothetical protein U1F77_16740 [Kiritimatiellia bacterium]